MCSDLVYVILFPQVSLIERADNFMEKSFHDLT